MNNDYYIILYYIILYYRIVNTIQAAPLTLATGAVAGNGTCKARQ